jgi:hypothetical protein
MPVAVIIIGARKPGLALSNANDVVSSVARRTTISEPRGVTSPTGHSMSWLSASNTGIAAIVTSAAGFNPIASERTRWVTM